MRTISERGFRYPLQPVLQRGQHLMEAGFLRAAQARESLRKAEEQCRALEARAVAEARLARHAWARRPDPALQQRSLAFVARLHDELAEALRDCERLRADATAAAGDAWKAMCKRDALASHREDALRTHRRAVEARVAAQADGDWLARAESGARDREGER